MLIGRDDISNDIITLGMRFSKFVYIHAHFDWRKSDSSVDREPQGNWRDVAASSPSFPTLLPERPGELAHRLTQVK